MKTSETIFLMRTQNSIIGEPIIRLPDSNGMAPGPRLQSAIRKGICEVVERDAVVITWLNKLSVPRIKIRETENESITDLIKAFDRYQLELHVFDITTDIPIPTVLTLAIDRSGVGPAVIAGTCSNFRLEEAIIQSIEELHQRRMWVRTEMLGGWIDKTAPNIDSIKEDYERGDLSQIDRQLLWSRIDMLPQLDFLLRTKKVKEIDSNDGTGKLRVDLFRRNAAEDLQNVMSFFNERGYEVAYVDVTTSDVDEIGFKVVKVIIPELQSITWASEEFKYLGGKRLYKLPEILGYQENESKENELNRIPHPF
jgi:ribosomal protein S12 methylthiotransferase accessory factor